MDNNQNKNVFHEHLDKCKRCRENPFDLCTIGLILIKQAVNDLTLDKNKEHD